MSRKQDPSNLNVRFSLPHNQELDINLEVTKYSNTDSKDTSNESAPHDTIIPIDQNNPDIQKDVEYSHSRSESTSSVNKLLTHTSKNLFKKIRGSLDIFSPENNKDSPNSLASKPAETPKSLPLEIDTVHIPTLDPPIKVRSPVIRSNSKLKKKGSGKHFRFIKKNEAKTLSSAKWHPALRSSKLKINSLDISVSPNSSGKNTPRLKRAGGKHYAEFRSRANSFSDNENDINHKINMAYDLQKDLEYAIPIAMKMISDSAANSAYHSRTGSFSLQDYAFSPNHNSNSNSNTNTNSYTNTNSNINTSNLNQSLYSRQLSSKPSDIKDNNANTLDGFKYKINRGSTGLETDNIPQNKFLDVEKSFSTNNTNSPSGHGSRPPSEFYKKIHNVSINRRFMIKMCYSLGSYGSPYYRMDTTLPRMATFLDINAKFIAFPSFILISFEESKDQSSKTEVVTIDPSYNLHKLDLTDALFEDVVSGKISVEDGLKEIRTIIKMDPLYPNYIRFLCNCLTSMGISMVAYGGGWSELWISLLLGILVNALSFASERYYGFKKIFVFSASLLIGFIATALEKYACFGSLTLSALFYLLPGLGLTVGIMELVAGSLIVGTVKVFHALVVTLTLSFSAQVGSTLFNAIFHGYSNKSSTINLDNCVPMDKRWILLFFPVCMFSIFVYLNTPRKRVPICLALSTIMYGVFWVLNDVAKLDYFATVAASFIIGILSNLTGKYLEIPPFLPLLPSVIMLVPGSIGVRSLSALLDGQPMTDLIMRMISSCLSIMIGLFSAAFFIFPSRKNNTALITF
ncbi:Pheromone-regulated membrane protein 10 [Smittium culicis]|uniref:Pheromone-regulated membrane protein 10 n=1 Tax=Smittium culicis TaxID=133412 RepID=A0A1R1Y0H1_9FUNG|nr:Pheromone-regulated membrane protein 10 [Smittium culicis]